MRPACVARVITAIDAHANPEPEADMLNAYWGSRKPTVQRHMSGTECWRANATSSIAHQCTALARLHRIVDEWGPRALPGIHLMDERLGGRDVLV